MTEAWHDPGRGAGGAGDPAAPGRGAGGAGDPAAPGRGAGGAGDPAAPGRGAGGAGDPAAPGRGAGGAGDPAAPGRGAEEAAGFDVERLLSDALRPIEPPERFSERVEQTLSAVTQAAAEELSDWADELSESELRALGEPRNWVRPVVAVAAGGVATGALVLMELRRRGRQRTGGLRGVAGQVRSRL
ncbi:MAG: hypothetical protein U0R52_02480 [Solirubrobacterales bacterium]